MRNYSDSTFEGTGKVPLVQTGPTYGQERSRTKSGNWTKKRSDAGKSRNGGGQTYVDSLNVSY